jgi:MFS family permease
MFVNTSSSELAPAPAPVATVLALPQLSDRRTLLPWYAAEFVHSFSVTVYTICVYFYAENQLHATPTQCLWLSAGWGFTYVFFALLAGHWSEKWGPRRLIARMGIGSGLTALLGLVLLHPALFHIEGIANLWVLFLAMTAFNFTCNQLWPPLESAITRSPGKMALSTRMALYNLTWGASNFLGFFCAPYVRGFGWNFIFIIPALGCLLAVGIVIWRAIPQSMILAEHVPDDAPTEAPDPRIARRATTLLHMAWIANAMAYVAINVVTPVLPTVVRISGVTAALATAVIVSSWSLMRSVGFVITWRWTGWHYSVRWLLGAFAVMGLSFATILVYPGNIPVLLAAEAVFGLTIALLYSASLYYAMHVSSGSGGHAGIHEALIGLGIGIGPTAGALAGASGGGQDSGRIAPGTILAVGGVLTAGFIALCVLGAKAGKKPQTT